MDQNKKLVLVLCVVLLLSTTVVHCGISLAPENVAASIGSSVVFNCTVSIPTDDFMAWRYEPLNGEAPGGIIIYQTRNGLNPDVSNLFAVEENTNSGTYNLIVKSVSLELGVKYWCGFMFDQTTASAGLVALQPMQCPKDLGRVEFYEGSTVNMSCSVDFVGYAPPILQWRDPDDNVIASQLVQNTTRVTALANVTLKAEDDDRPFSCHLSFQNNLGVKANTPATNLPSYTDNCTTTLYVIHPVTDVLIEPAPDASGVITDPLYTGETLNCTASGRPLPSFTWIGPGGYTLDADMLEITDAMVDMPQPITVMCMAKNTISGTAYVASNNATFTALPVSPAEVQSGGVEAWVIAVAVVVPIVVIAIACIAGYLFYRHRKSKDKKPSSSGTTSATPFISPYPSSGGGGGTQPPPANRYPPTTTTTNSAFVPVTRAAPLANGTTTPGYGDISGGLNGSTNRLNYAPPPGTNVARPAPATNGVRPGNAGHSSSGSSTPSTTQINPPAVSMRPNPVSPVPRAGVNQSRPIYSPVNNANQRPPSVASSSSRATSNYVPSASGAGGVGASSRLNYSSSAHGSVV